MVPIKKFTVEDVDRILRNSTPVDLHPILSEFTNFILHKYKITFLSNGITSKEIQAVIIILKLEYDLGLINSKEFFQDSSIEFPAFIEVLWKFHDDIKLVEQQLNKQ